MNFTHFIHIPFTGVGLYRGFRGDEWYTKRITLFRDYTLKSLANQTNKEFRVWVSFRPQEESNPLTHLIRRALKKEGIKYVLTFHGLPYWDDKFSPKWVEKYRTITKYWNRMTLGNFMSVLGNPNHSLEPRISRMLTELAPHVDGEWVYVTHLDSDDMFHKDAIAEIQKQPPALNRAFVFTNGYIYNHETGQLADWNPPTNPPFHTIVFPTEVFLNAKEHLEYYDGYRSHEDITKIFDCVQLHDKRYSVLTGGKGHISTEWESSPEVREYRIKKYGQDFRGKEYKGYMYVVHGKNISTKWQSQKGVKNPMIGEERNKDEILKEFGL